MPSPDKPHSLVESGSVTKAVMPLQKFELRIIKPIGDSQNNNTDTRVQASFNTAS